jgi:hypothetical protein
MKDLQQALGMKFVKVRSIFLIKALERTGRAAASGKYHIRISPLWGLGILICRIYLSIFRPSGTPEMKYTKIIYRPSETAEMKMNYDQMFLAPSGRHIDSKYEYDKFLSCRAAASGKYHLRISPLWGLGILDTPDISINISSLGTPEGVSGL